MSLLDDLRARAAFASSVWKPVTEGEGIEGTITSIDRRDPNEARRISGYDILTVRLNDGRTVRWHASGKVAGDELARELPTVGSRIAVLYGGKARSAGGDSFERWAVAVAAEPARIEPDRAARLKARMDAISDVETRHRVKLTFARLWGVPASLDDIRARAATAWLDAVDDGTVTLDPLPGRP